MNNSDWSQINRNEPWETGLSRSYICIELSKHLKDKNTIEEAARLLWQRYWNWRDECASADASRERFKSFIDEKIGAVVTMYNIVNLLTK